METKLVSVSFHEDFKDQCNMKIHLIKLTFFILKLIFKNILQKIIKDNKIQCFFVITFLSKAL